MEQDLLRVEKARTASEQMAGVNGLMSLSVRLGDVCNLSRKAREFTEDEQVRKKVEKEAPSVRMLSGISNRADKKLLIEVARGLKS